MNAYLGLVPRCHDSGGKSRPGHITRESRKLSRTILTQSIYQTIKATPQWERDYEELKARRGSGRARIAMIRRLCGVMRRMLLQGEQFHWLKEELYRRKLVEYQKTLEGRENIVKGYPRAQPRNGNQGQDFAKAQHRPRFAGSLRRRPPLFERTDVPIGRIWAVLDVFVPGNRHTSLEGRNGGTCQLSRSGSNPGSPLRRLLLGDASRAVVRCTRREYGYCYLC
jgi:hypothetical protein